MRGLKKSEVLALVALIVFVLAAGAPRGFGG